MELEFLEGRYCVPGITAAFTQGGDGRMFADASRASWFMFGAGGNTVWIDPESEAVVVWRWLDGAHSAGFVSRVAGELST